MTRILINRCLIKKADEQEYGTYTLRNGGVERFDTRNARELIRYLLELLRSESAAFSSYGYDFMATTLKEMYQKISLMEQKTKRLIPVIATRCPTYIIVKPFEGFDMMYAKYWTTLAETANHIRVGTRLQLGKGLKSKTRISHFIDDSNRWQKQAAFRRKATGIPVWDHDKKPDHYQSRYPQFLFL
jgi:hypothetical protein